MSTVSPPSSSVNQFFWRELYRTALFESDPGKLYEDIQHAESAIVLRARQLFGQPGDHIDEEHDLDDALYALQALKSCAQSRTAFADAA
jgi:hypothetical protein